MESFETKSFTSNGGLLTKNKLQNNNPYRSWKWIHYNPGFNLNTLHGRSKNLSLDLQFKMRSDSKPF
jgi:hypothetical protein